MIIVHLLSRHGNLIYLLYWHCISTACITHHRNLSYCCPSLAECFCNAKIQIRYQVTQVTGADILDKCTGYFLFRPIEYLISGLCTTVLENTSFLLTIVLAYKSYSIFLSGGGILKFTPQWANLSTERKTAMRWYLNTRYYESYILIK